MPDVEYELWYYCENNGDGSASVHFCESESEANTLDEAQPEPWGESSVGSIELKLVDGRLSFEKRVWIPSKKKELGHYETVLKHVSEVVPK
jgi:hypothetical protein